VVICLYYLIHIFYGLIFALSFLGYALLHKAKTKLPICLFPITAASGMIVVVYLFGLLGFLQAGCFAAVAGGLLCLWFYRSWKSIKEIFCDWSILFCFFAFIWLFFITRHSELTHWDDFTHWYRICKAMNYEAAYPTTPDISFYTYVPGTATWIYLVTRFIGFNVSNCFLAQGILNIACLACFFADIKEFKDIAGRCLFVISIGFVSVLLCSMASSAYTLLVDTLVGLVPLTALIMILYGNNDKQIQIPVCLILSFAAIIKNSCLLLVIITLVIAGLKFKFSQRQWLKYSFLWVIIPILLYRLYFVHASIYYAGAAGARQDISFDRFYALLKEKDLNVICEVAKNFFIRITDIGGDARVTIVYLLLLSFILLYLFAKCFSSLAAKKEKISINSFAGRIKNAFIAAIVIMIIYSVGLFCTYIFSMNTGEAKRLAAFYRYFAQVAIYLCGAGIYIFLHEISLCKNCKKSFLLPLCLILVFILGFFDKGYILGKSFFNPEEPGAYSQKQYAAFVNNIPENYYYKDDSYLVIWNVQELDTSNSLLQMGAKVWLRSNNIKVISSTDIVKGLDEKVLQRLADYDYLVTLSDMSEQVELLKEYLPVKDYQVGICPIGGD